MISVISLPQVNLKLVHELEMVKQKLSESQSHLKEIKAQRFFDYKQITELNAECSKLSREKEELLKLNEGQHEELHEINGKCSQLR